MKNKNANIIIIDAKSFPWVVHDFIGNNQAK